MYWAKYCIINCKGLVIGTADGNEIKKIHILKMLTRIWNTLFEIKWYGLSQTGALLLPKGANPAPSSFLISFHLQASALPLVSAQPFICLHSKHDQFADLLET